MTALAKNGKGILLMHDFQHVTAEAMPELLRQLKAGGYKIVHMVPKDPVTTLANYDEMVRAKDKATRPATTRGPIERRQVHQRVTRYRRPILPSKESIREVGFMTRRLRRGA